MAVKRPQSECIEHTIELTKLKEQMETVIRHDKKYNEAIDNFDMAIRDINLSLVRINGTLDHFKEIPDKVRKLEDKSIVISLVEKGLWFVVGVGISVIIQNNYIATKEDHNYKIEKTK